MKKFSLILLFILGFFIVFAVSAVITFTLTLDRGEEPTEAVTEAIDMEGEIPTAAGEIEDEVAVTRVTPSLSVADAIIVKTVYGAKVEEAESNYEMPEAVVADDVQEDIIENEVVEVKDEQKPKTEEKKEDIKVETPKTETKKEEVKVETPKTEVKKEDVKAEAPKAEEKKEDVKAQEPVVEEKVEEIKPQEPVVEEKPVVLDPNKQYSDTGI